jgi:hypothetical protein
LNEVKIVVTVDGPVGDGFEKARTKSKTFGDGVKQDLDKAGKASSDFDRLVTRNLKDGETAFQSAGRSAEELRGKVDKLRQDFKSTGNQGIFGDLTAAEGDLRKLEGFMSAMEPEFRARGRKLGKATGDGMLEGIPLGIGKGAMALGGLFVKLVDKIAPDVAAEAAKLGEKAGKAMADGLASAGDAVAQDAPLLFSPEGAAGAAILAVVGGALAPALGAAVGAAVTFALGAGMVGAAAFLLRDEPAIRAAGHRLKEDLLGDLTSGASVLAGPLEKAINILDSITNKIDFGRMFAGLAPALAPLAHALGSILYSLTQGLGNVGNTFGKIFSDPSMEHTLQGLGTDLQALFDTAARHGPEIEVTLKVIFGLIEEIIGAVNMLINVGAFFATPLTWFDKGTGGAERFAAAATDAALALHGAASAASVAAPTIQDLMSQLSATTETFDTLAGAATDKLMAGLLGLDMATNNFNKSLVTLGDTLVANGGHLSAHVAALKKSETGAQQNKDAVLAVVQANLQVYDSMISVGISAKDAAAKYDANTKALEDQLRAAGYTTKQIHALVGQYEGVPGKVNSVLAIQGLTTAIDHLTTLLALINGIPRDVYVTTHVSTRQITDKRNSAHHAAGGIAAGLTWVGEQGAELVRLPQGSMVYPHGQSVGMASSMAGSSGPSQLTMTIAPGAAGGLTALITNLFRTGQIRLTVRDSTGKTQAVSVAGG